MAEGSQKTSVRDLQDGKGRKYCGCNQWNKNGENKVCREMPLKIVGIFEK